jgi:rhodanese-related sulfurtransferase
MRILLAATLALAPMSLALTATSAQAEATAEAPEVSLEELKKMVQSKSATIIDANGEDMYKDGHIPGAVSFAKNENNFASILPKDKNAPIVAYCGGPLCTAWKQAAKEAQKLGYTNIKHFKGGIKGWKQAGEPTEKG